MVDNGLRGGGETLEHSVGDVGRAETTPTPSIHVAHNLLHQVTVFQTKITIL